MATENPPWIILLRTPKTLTIDQKRKLYEKTENSIKNSEIGTMGFKCIVYEYQKLKEYFDYEKQTQQIETHVSKGKAIILDNGMILDNLLYPFSLLGDFSLAYAVEQRGSLLFSKIPIFNIDHTYRLMGGLKPKLYPIKYQKSKYLNNLIFKWEDSDFEYLRQIELAGIEPETNSLFLSLPLPDSPINTKIKIRKLSRSEGSVSPKVLVSKLRETSEPFFPPNKRKIPKNGYDLAYYVHLYRDFINLEQYINNLKIYSIKYRNMASALSHNEYNLACAINSSNPDTKSNILFIIEKVLVRSCDITLFSEKGINFLNMTNVNKMVGALGTPFTTLDLQLLISTYKPDIIRNIILNEIKTIKISPIVDLMINGGLECCPQELVFFKGNHWLKKTNSLGKHIIQQYDKESMVFIYTASFNYCQQVYLTQNDIIYLKNNNLYFVSDKTFSMPLNQEFGDFDFYFNNRIVSKKWPFTYCDYNKKNYKYGNYENLPQKSIIIAASVEGYLLLYFNNTCQLIFVREYPQNVIYLTGCFVFDPNYGINILEIIGLTKLKDSKSFAIYTYTPGDRAIRSNMLTID